MIVKNKHGKVQGGFGRGFWSLSAKILLSSAPVGQRAADLPLLGFGPVYKPSDCQNDGECADEENPGDPRMTFLHMESCQGMNPLLSPGFRVGYL